MIYIDNCKVKRYTGAMMTIHAKVGTIPRGIVRVKSKRYWPIVGEHIYIKSAEHKDRFQAWERVHVNRIEKYNSVFPQDYYYFLELC